MKHSVFEALAEAARREEKVALGIITGVKGSSPQKLGAKALFFPDGRINGTLGGGCLEAEIQQRALRSLQTGESSTFELVLDHDFGWDDGLICGGKVFGVILPNAQNVGEKFWRKLAERKSISPWGVKTDFSIAMESRAGVPPVQRTRQREAEVIDKKSGRLEARPTFDWLYQESIAPPCPLWIAGAGHIAQAVAPLASKLDFDVTVFDDRPALCNYEFFPDEITLRVGDWDKLLQETPTAQSSFALVVTRGHRHDALVLKDWIQKDFAFIGMIGSARKARIIFDHLLEEKIATAEQTDRVACPVGIKILSESVEEIAVSIMAQFIEKRATVAG
ncbi:MAG: XdhC family protein [Verrucomicrobiota bacterium]